MECFRGNRSISDAQNDAYEKQSMNKRNRGEESISHKTEDTERGREEERTSFPISEMTGERKCGL